MVYKTLQNTDIRQLLKQLHLQGKLIKMPKEKNSFPKFGSKKTQQLYDN